MRRFRTLLSLAVLLFLPPDARATWSIVAVDRSTGTIVIASATCVPQRAFAGFPAKDLRDVQAIVVPGKGVAAAQAAVDNTRANQKLIFAQLQKGTPPEQIIAMLREDPQIARRQFGIVDIQGRMAGFSGERNLAVSLDRQGQVPGSEIFFSIQGNILASEAVVSKAIDAFIAAKGDLADRTMAGMEAADAAGGDSRCACDKGPAVNAPCTTRTAHVAYLLEALKDDASGESYNDGTYHRYISVTDQDITPQEDANPVKTLRMRYDQSRKR